MVPGQCGDRQSPPGGGRRDHRVHHLPGPRRVPGAVAAAPRYRPARCLGRPGRRRTRGIAAPQARGHDPHVPGEHGLLMAPISMWHGNPLTGGPRTRWAEHLITPPRPVWPSRATAGTAGTRAFAGLRNETVQGKGESGVEQAMTRGRVRAECGRKRVRAYLGGELAADTTSPLLVWEVPYYPAYYIPAGDIRADLVPTGATDHSPSRGEAGIFDVRTPAATAPSAARRYASSPIEQLRQAVRLDWDAMDEWLEEDEPVYTHPRDPYTRVDILASSRHVRVEVDGLTVADCGQPRI